MRSWSDIVRAHLGVSREQGSQCAWTPSVMRMWSSASTERDAEDRVYMVLFHALSGKQMNPTFKIGGEGLFN